MQAPPAGLRFALAHGVEAEIEVVGGSMEPSIAKGTKVRVDRLDADGPLVPGELVVLETQDDAVLLLHRVVHMFTETGQSFVIHQGDAPSSGFGVCRREDVVGKATGIVGGASTLPTLDTLPRQDLDRFHRRRIAARAFAAARGMTASLGIRNHPIARAVGDVYRKLARRITG